MGLVIPADALSKDTKISVQEVDNEPANQGTDESFKKLPQGFRLQSPI